MRAFLTDLVGRKHLGCKASIPAPLEGAFDLWPDGDHELVSLTQYDPQPAQLTAPRPEIYPATIEALLRNPPAPASSTVNIDQLDQILSLSPKPHYEDLFKVILQRKGQYPVPPPLPPSELEPRRPPNWTPCRRIFETPSFRPPITRLGCRG